MQQRDKEAPRWQEPTEEDLAEHIMVCITVTNPAHSAKIMLAYNFLTHY